MIQITVKPMNLGSASGSKFQLVGQEVGQDLEQGGRPGGWPRYLTERREKGRPGVWLGVPLGLPLYIICRFVEHWDKKASKKVMYVDSRT